jgi:hypothetical protein
VEEDSIKPKREINYLDYFIVDEYNKNNKTLRFIDSFAVQNKKADWQSYNSYAMHFYKKSRATNLENLTRNPKDFLRHTEQDDIILSYHFGTGNKYGRVQYENGVALMAQGDTLIISDPK